MRSAARAKANLKVRQPLQEVSVRVPRPDEGRVLEQLADQVLEELNIKQLSVIGEDANLFEYSVKPNLPVVGPKYGSEVGKITRAINAATSAFSSAAPEIFVGGVGSAFAFPKTTRHSPEHTFRNRSASLVGSR